MNAVPPSITAAGTPAFAQSGTSAMSERWTALADAGNVVATLAGLEAEGTSAEMRNFPAPSRGAASMRRTVLPTLPR